MEAHNAPPDPMTRVWGCNYSDPLFSQPSPVARAPHWLNPIGSERTKAKGKTACSLLEGGETSQTGKCKLSSTVFLAKIPYFKTKHSKVNIT